MAHKYYWKDSLTADSSKPGGAIGKIVCVGRNYAAHAAELNNPVPEKPLLFMKPASAVVAMERPLDLSEQEGQVHYETEIALLIGKRLRAASASSAWEAVSGVGLALDLTLRDLQSELKKQGHPWERAKAFDGACPLSRFVPLAAIADREHIEFSLTIDGEVRQKGDSRKMITTIPELLAEISRTFTLEPGDIVLTGTPEGVGQLKAGQSLDLQLADQLTVSTRIV